MSQPFQAELLSLESALDWYEQVRIAINEDRSIQEQIAQGLISRTPHKHLIGRSLDELQSHYSDLLAEHEKVAALNLLAAAESILRRDYLYRASKKLPDAASVAFRKIYKGKSKRAKLVEDLLAVWKAVSGTPALVGELVGAFNYRNWLAHGRYWHPGLGQEYDVESVLIIIQQAFGSLGADFVWD